VRASGAHNLLQQEVLDIEKEILVTLLLLLVLVLEEGLLLLMLVG